MISIIRLYDYHIYIDYAVLSIVVYNKIENSFIDRSWLYLLSRLLLVDVFVQISLLLGAITSKRTPFEDWDLFI